jgi:predicted metal-dependent HD superfamily phosphohydrolase
MDATPPLVLPAAQLAALREAHATPPRAYHGFDHVQSVLRHWREVATGPGWARPRETWLAVLYHDAVYVPGHRDNEARSADLAREAIARWLPEAGVDAARVAWLIGLTARHGSLAPRDCGDGADGDDARLFLDCDMAILGAAPAEFDAYDRAIAEEYRGVVPAMLYRFNRRRFLAGLLERPRIFLSDFFHARLDAAARANLRRVLGDAH